MAADIVISLSFLLAATALAYYAKKQSNQVGRKIALCSASIIFLCGVAQLFPVISEHQSERGTVFSFISFIPALAIGLTVFMLWFLIVHAVKTPRQSMGQLEDMVVQLKHEVAERKRAELELQKSQELLRQLAAYQEQVKEDERKRIAREIHDDLGQNLMALRIDVSLLQTRTSHSHPLLNEQVSLALQHIDTSIKAVRTIINNLRPSVLDLGLYAAIEWQVNEFERRTGIECTVLMDEEKADFDLDDQRATALFRILQESLTNVARHAQANKVWIELQRMEDTLLMKISDNGVGIYPGCRRKPNSFGLLGIGERINMLGGEFSVESPPGQGTVLIISIPLEKQVAEEIA
jgi:signal transduction histidine kinase